MAQVFLAPMGTFTKSVVEGVPLTQLKIGLSEREYAKALPLADNGKVRLWGCHKGTGTAWKAMKEGDVVLFVPKGVGMYTDYGRVAFKSMNTKLAHLMKEGGIWPLSSFKYVFFLRDHKSISISKARIARLGGWKSNGPPQKFMRISSEAVSNVIVDILLPNLL